MIANPFPEKPKLVRRGGIWFCSGASISACGPSPKAAFREYQRQKRVMERWCDCDVHRNSSPEYRYSGFRGSF